MFDPTDGPAEGILQFKLSGWLDPTGDTRILIQDHTCRNYMIIRIVVYRVHHLINLNVESPIQRSMISLSSKKYNGMLAGLERRESRPCDRYPTNRR